MTVWADADSLPREVRELIARRAEAEFERAGDDFRAVFVANRDIGAKPTRAVSFLLAGPGQGAADDAIAERASPGDIVVTKDIPFAERLLEAHGDAIGVINDRGGRFGTGNIRERRSARDAMLELRLSGLVESGRRSYSRKEAGAFARAFDAEISRLKKAAGGGRG